MGGSRQRQLGRFRKGSSPIFVSLCHGVATNACTAVAGFERQCMRRHSFTAAPELESISLLMLYTTVEAGNPDAQGPRLFAM